MEEERDEWIQSESNRLHILIENKETQCEQIRESLSNDRKSCESLEANLEIIRCDIEKTWQLIEKHEKREREETEKKENIQSALKKLWAQNIFFCDIKTQKFCRLSKNLKISLLHSNKKKIKFFIQKIDENIEKTERFLNKIKFCRKKSISFSEKSIFIEKKWQILEFLVSFAVIFFFFLNFWLISPIFIRHREQITLQDDLNSEKVQLEKAEQSLRILVGKKVLDGRSSVRKVLEFFR